MIYGKTILEHVFSLNNLGFGVTNLEPTDGRNFLDWQITIPKPECLGHFMGNSHDSKQPYEG